MDISERVAGIVNEWFQGLPTTREQQRDRSGLIWELVHEMEKVRAAVAEEIAKDLESDGQFEFQLDGDYAARIAREHGKEA
jgi:hypothetical protein